MSFRFRPGDAVRVRVAYPHSHCRTPFYCRGKQGVGIAPAGGGWRRIATNMRTRRDRRHEGGWQAMAGRA